MSRPLAVQSMRNQPLGKRTLEIVEYRFKNPTVTQRSIAEHFGIGESRIANILNSERVQAVYPILARKAVKSMVPQAISRFNELMNQKVNLEVSRKVSERVLDSEKVLEPQPLVNINVISDLKINELRKIVDDTKSLPDPSIDTESL